MNKLIKFLIVPSLLLLSFSKEAHGMRKIASLICKPIHSIAAYFSSPKKSTLFQKFKLLEEIDLKEIYGEDIDVNHSIIKNKYIVFSARHIKSLDHTVNNVVVYDMEKKKEILRYNHNSADCFCLSEDCKYVASANWKYVKVYDIQNKKMICRCKTNTPMIKCICFSENGKYVALGSCYGRIIVYDTQKNEELYSYRHNHAGYYYYDGVYRLMFSRDKKIIVSTHCNGDETSYDIENKQEICKRNNKVIKNLFDYLINYLEVTKITFCFSEDEKYAAQTRSDLSYHDQTVAIFKIQNKNEMKEICRYKTGNESVSKLLFSKDARFIISGGWKKATVYDTQNHKKVYLCKHNASISCVKFTNDGDKLISVSDDGIVKIHKTSSDFYHSVNAYAKRKKKSKETQNNLNLNKNEKNFCDCIIMCSKQENPSQSKIKAFSQIKNIE